MREKCPYSEVFWSIFSRKWTEYGPEKLRIRTLGEDKTKSILFISKFTKKNIKKLNLKYGDTQIKQHSKVKYLGCLMDETMSEEAMKL